jgi:chemotaxis family two-component system response regulator Rcp1
MSGANLRRRGAASTVGGVRCMPIQILLVEDNPGDVRLTQEVFKQARMANQVRVVNDGEAALAAVRQQGAYAEWPRPDLIMLDLNLPRLNGLEVLQALKADPDLGQIPVIILTTSEAERDIVESYRLHANCYVSKPISDAEFIDAVRSIKDFWLSIVRLPEGEGELAPA